MNKMLITAAALLAQVDALRLRQSQNKLVLANEDISTVLANFNPTAGATLRGDMNSLVLEASATQTQFIGQSVMPPFPVPTKSGQYPKLQIAAGDLLKPMSTVRSRGGSYGEVTRQWTTDTYDCIDRGLEEPVDDTDVLDMSRYFDLEMNAAQNVLKNMMLDHESRVSAQIYNTTNFGAGTNSVVAYTAVNIATIDFVQDVTAAIERVKDKGGAANTIVMNSVVFARLVAATKLQNFIRGQYGAKDSPINAKSVQAAFADMGIENVFIGSARQDTAKKGQAASISSIWSNTYCWVGEVVSSPTVMQQGGAGYTLVWNQEGGIFVTESYRVPGRRSTLVRVRQNTTEKVVDGTSGTLITTQYS